MTDARLTEIRAFIDTNPVHATMLVELADALVTANKQIAYYTRQLSAKYLEVVDLQRKLTAPRCDDCGAEMVECGPDGDMHCLVCYLEAKVKRLDTPRPRVDEDDERGPRGLR